MSAEADEGERPRGRRLFFALWPDAAVRAALFHAAREPVRLSGGQATPKDRLHVTLAFLGSLTDAGLEIARGVPPIAVGAFDLTFDRLGSFANGGVLWAGLQLVPSALLDLERRLWDELEGRGFVREQRLYHPHLTLARRCRRTVDVELPPVPWRATELALVESLPAGRKVHYEVLETWPL
jgi:RNA 2',3'-cyclic 3'-phosphodiesterase